MYLYFVHACACTTQLFPCATVIMADKRFPIWRPTLLIYVIRHYSMIIKCLYGIVTLRTYITLLEMTCFTTMLLDVVARKRCRCQFGCPGLA